MTLLTQKKDICVMLVVSAAAKVHPNKKEAIQEQ